MTSTDKIIKHVLRQLEHNYVFMPGAVERISNTLGDKITYTPSWIDEAERLINNEKLTLKKLEQSNVTITNLIAWQMWMIHRDEMI